MALSSGYLDYTSKDEDDTATGTYIAHGITFGEFVLDWAFNVLELSVGDI